MNMRNLFAALSLLTLGFAGAASAQTEKNRLWPTFDVAVGSYQVSSSDKIKVEGSIERLGREINLDEEFGLGDRASVFGGGFHWAFADKHSLGLNTYAIKRDASRSINRDIELGGVVFPVGASASVEFKQTTIEATYDYWFVRRDNFGFGGSFGLVYLSLDAKAEASYRFGSSGQTTTVRESASTDLPVPMIGVVVKGSPWRWLVLRGALRYLPEVTIDFHRFQQSLEDLIENAIKFTPYNGEIRIEIAVMKNSIEIMVTDSGPGIPVKFHERIFDKFYQIDQSTTRAVEGAGIGLSLARHIVELHGGTISVLSKEGEGSTFKISLPKQHILS